MNDIKELLKDSNDRLLSPLLETRRTYLIIFNTFNALFTTSFMLYGKFVLGNFVVAPPLLGLYILSISFSIVTASYNILQFKRHKFNSTDHPLLTKLLDNKKLDSSLGTISAFLILLMSLGGITGYGNPSSDAIITTFSFAHAMIVGISVIMGKWWSLSWGILVVIILIWNVNQKGWDYTYHYQTRSEAAAYEKALERGEPWAMQRKSELERDQLSPSPITRYFRLWLIFTATSIVLAYIFGSLLDKTYKVLPSVIDNIQKTIAESTKINFELDYKRSEAIKVAEELSHLKIKMKELETAYSRLPDSDRVKFVPLMRIARQMENPDNDNIRWHEFESLFNSLYPNFWAEFQKTYPDINLDPKEMQHVAYLKSGIESKEIALRLNYTLDTLKTKRYLLKNKLGINGKLIENIRNL